MVGMCIIAWFTVGTHEPFSEPPIGPMSCAEAHQMVLEMPLADTQRYPVIRAAPPAHLLME